MKSMYRLRRILIIVALVSSATFAFPTICRAQDTGYWAALMWYPNEGDAHPYAVSNVFRARGCPSSGNYSDEVLKYVKSKIEIPHPETFFLICYSTYEETANKLRAPASYQVRTRWTIPDMGGGSSNSAPDVDTTDNESDGESDGEADSDSSSSNTATTAQKNSKIAPNGSVDSTAWTEEDGKKYTQGKKGHWVTGSFKATAWCADKMFMATHYVDACVVDEEGSASPKGTFLSIQNISDDFPVYYGLSGVFNKKLEPHQTVTEDLATYVPIDPAKRAKLPDTVVEILVKYWVEDK